MSTRKRRTRAPERAHQLAVARRRKGLTQEALAELVGVKRLTIIRIEGGQMTPSLKLALRIAKVLGEPVETLFGGER